MTTKQGITISLRTAKTMAFLFFIIGTFLFLFGALTNFGNAIVITGIIYTAFAAFFNAIVIIILFVDLVRKDRLESFFALCVTLLNIPIAIGYFYLINQMPFLLGFY